MEKAMLDEIDNKINETIKNLKQNNMELLQNEIFCKNFIMEKTKK